MGKKHEEQQSQPDNHMEKLVEASPDQDANVTPHIKEQEIIEVSRARMIPDSERLVRQGTERIQQRKLRETKRTRDIGSSVRPHASRSGFIQQQEKRPPLSQSVVQEEKIQEVGVLEDRETVKWAAWAALLISLAALVLVGIYSVQDFSPVFEVHDLETAQKQITADVNALKLATRLQTIKSAVITAHLQLFLYKDHAVAEAMLVNAKQDMNTLIESLPIEKRAEPRKILNEIEKAIRELRKEPLQLDDMLKAILLDLDNM